MIVDHSRSRHPNKVMCDLWEEKIKKLERELSRKNLLISKLRKKIKELESALSGNCDEVY